MSSDPFAAQRFMIRLCCFVCIGMCTANANPQAAAANDALEKFQSRYAQVQSYRADGMVLEYETDKSDRVGIAQSFSLIFDRKKGIKLVVHSTDRSGHTVDTTAWGPLGEIQVYVEHKFAGYIELTETPNKNIRYASPFNQLVSYTATNPGDTLGALLIDGKLPMLNGKSDVQLMQENGRNILQQGTDYWRQYIIESANNNLVEIKTHSDGNLGRWSTEIKLLHQDFNATVSQQELSYRPPAYARAFDPRNGLDDAQRREVMTELAKSGNKNGQIELLLGGVFKDGQVPNSATFLQLTQNLHEAERMRYPGAYRTEAELYQPSNRNWFPADLAALSDESIYARQRDILWDGLSQCDLESANALNAAHPPLSQEEKTRYKSQWDICAEKMIPEAVRKAEANLNNIRQ